MRIKPGVHTYDLEWEGFGEPLSVHVVEADETLLFGGGDASTADELAEITRDHDVDVVVVEHGDPDHYMGVPRLRELGVKVAVPEGDASRLRDDGIEPDFTLEPSEGYWGVEVVGAPGHTPGNAAYVYDGVLVAGDTVVGADSGFARPSESALSVIESDWNADDEDAVASVASLLEHGFEAVLVTHGSNVVENGKKEIEKLVEALPAD
jgi:glyoxylase-like metal-dependent hydrolase (beta-lactamase superfamily II)